MRQATTARKIAAPEKMRSAWAASAKPSASDASTPETTRSIVPAVICVAAPVRDAGRLGSAGPLYTTYADAFASTNGGTDLVVGAQLTLDSGFAGDQTANVSNVTVNDNTWGPEHDRDDKHDRDGCVREDLQPATG